MVQRVGGTRVAVELERRGEKKRAGRREGCRGEKRMRGEGLSETEALRSTARLRDVFEGDLLVRFRVSVEVESVTATYQHLSPSAATIVEGENEPSHLRMGRM